MDLARARDWPGAIQCYESALAEDEEDDVAWYKKGVALTMLKHFEEAVACFDRALAISPVNPDAWFNKGSALANGFGNYREAILCFQEAKKLGDADADKAISLCLRKLASPARSRK